MSQEADNKAVAQTSGSTDNPLLEAARQLVQRGQFPAIYVDSCPFSYSVYGYSSIWNIENAALSEGNLGPWERALTNSVNEAEIEKWRGRDRRPILMFGLSLACTGFAASARYVSVFKGNELVQLDTPAGRESYEIEAGVVCLDTVYKEIMQPVAAVSPQEMANKGIHMHLDVSQEQVIQKIRECIPSQTQMLVDARKDFFKSAQDSMTFGTGAFSVLAVAFFAAGMHKYFHAKKTAEQALETLNYIKGLAEEKTSKFTPL